MKINNNIISFKSILKMYKKEISSIKNNTIRFISNEAVAKFADTPFSYIEITNVETNT